MGTYYVAYFPDLSNHDWISEFRRKYDPKAEFVQPHITLVNPVSEFSLQVLEKEVSFAAKNTKKFKTIFRSSLMMPEIGHDGKNMAYIFLVPDEGFSSILKLRSQLYQGELKRHLRLDIPFVPHITIGFVENLQKAKDLVEELNSKPFELSMTIDRISIVEIESSNKARSVIKEIQLS